LTGGRVEQCAGPWRTSGTWWEDAPGVAAGLVHRSLGGGGSLGEGGWDRDEWDVTLDDGATYRVFRERDSEHWFLEGIVD
jgi:protein ImuB